MNRRQKIIVSVTGIFLVLLILLGLTYAYFLTQITGNTNNKSISVTTANLALVYGDGTGVITATNILPGTTLDSKTFTVTNQGNAKTDYVVIIEDVSVTYATTVGDDVAGTATTFESNDFVYTLTCETGCNGVDTETSFPITGGILVVNSIEVGATQTYSLTVTYKETGLDQSNDMNKVLAAKVNITDPNEFNPYVGEEESLAYTIINNAIALTSEERNNGYAELRATPLTTPAVETTTSYSDGGVGEEKTYNYVKTISPTASYYFTYGDTYTYTTKYTLTNEDGSDLKAVQLSTGYETLKGKYIVSTSGSASTTPVSGSDINSIYYVENATSTTIEYMNVYRGIKNNDYYITYGDSYKFNKTTGNYDILNKDGSALQTVKYSEGYKTVLPGKYVVSYSGTYYGNVASNATNLSTIYQITNSSTETQVAYKTLTKNIAEDSYTSAENTLSMTQDEYGTSYYYRGGVKNNYLEFNNMCWRIVRIEGDGSIKITLAAQKTCSEITSEDTGSAFIGTGDYGYTDGGYISSVSYYYYKADYEVGTMKKAFNVFLNGGTFNNYTDEWATEQITYTAWSDEAKSKLKSETICIGDTTKYDKDRNILSEITSTTWYYDTSLRLNKDKTASLVCNTNGSRTSSAQIFPLTADEIAFAGGVAGKDNYSYYLRENATSESWLTSSLSSSEALGDLSDTSYSVSSTGSLIGQMVYHPMNDYSSFRPAVSLIKGIEFNSGDGSISNPYTIK